MKVIVAGGGTAGHITPILATLEQLRILDPRIEILYVGSGHQLEQKLLKQTGIEYIAIPSGKYRRYRRGLVRAALDIKTNAKNARDMLRVNAGYLRARRIIRQFKPDVVFIKGGYVGLPIGLAAQRMHIPTVLHDSDTVLGLTNRILAKQAVNLATGFPIQYYDNNTYHNLIYVGNPIKEDTIKANAGQAASFFNFVEQKPNILLYGGSLGAKVINEAVFENLGLLTKEYNIIHITGEQGIEQARFLSHKLPDELRESYRPFNFLRKEMGLAYAAADLVVCRSGANAIAELAAWGKAAILVPLNSAANNEQLHNAESLVKAGAARMLLEEDLSGRRLVSEIDRLMADPKDREYLKQHIVKFHKQNSAKELAELILEASKQNKEGKGEKKSS